MLWLNRQQTIFALLTVIGLTLAWWPMSYNEPTTKGIDAYEYHGPLFGNHTQSQTLRLEQPLEAMGALLVPLRRADITPDVTVTFTDTATNAILQSQTIPGSSIHDDTFAYIRLTPPLTADTPVRVTLSAPTASAETALAVRFHPDDVYPEGERFFDDKPVNGDLALALQKQLPLWQVVLKIAHYNARTTIILALALAIAVLSAGIASQLGWQALSPPVRRRVELSILTILALATIVSRLPTLTYLGGVSGGDPYNFLFITNDISQFKNPFEGTKRLPGYPVLLLPAYLSPLDDITWMRLVNIMSAGGIVFLTGLLARRLGLGWSGQFFAAAFLAFQKDFYWISLRPEAYTFYALLLVASLVLFFSLTTWRRQLLFGLVLGYAAMTRQEGFVLAATLGLAAVLHTLVRWQQTREIATTKALVKSYTLAFLPALLLVIPFFIHNTLAYGNPVYTPYFEGERLNIVDSWPAFQDAAGATWGILGSLWKKSWDQLERLPIRNLTFITSGFVALAWWAYHRWRLARQTPTESIATIILSLLIIILSVLGFARTTNAFAPLFMSIAAATLIVAPLAVVGTLCWPRHRRGWPGVLLVLVGSTQILIATWFHPFPKHYQQDLSLISLALAIVLITSTISQPRWRRAAAAATYLAVAFTFALAILPLYEPSHFYSQLDDENQGNALDSVVYRAITAAKELPGPYGIDQGHLPARLYLQEQGHFYENMENSSPELEADWLTNNHIQTLIATNLNPVFTTLPPGWELVASFKAEGKNEQLIESFVYTRP